MFIPEAQILGSCPLERRHWHLGVVAYHLPSQHLKVWGRRMAVSFRTFCAINETLFLVNKNVIREERNKTLEYEYIFLVSISNILVYYFYKDVYQIWVEILKIKTSNFKLFIWKYWKDRDSCSLPPSSKFWPIVSLCVFL